MLAVLVVIWGTSFALLKIAVQTISPAWTVSGRMVLGAAFLIAVMLLRGRRLPVSASAWLWFVWLSIIGNVVPYYLITWGIQHIDSALAGIMMACGPLFTVALAQLVLPDEKMSLARAGGFVVAFAGVVLLVGPAALATLSGAGSSLIAQLAIIGAAFCYAGTSVSSRFVPRIGVLERSAGALIVSAVLCTSLTLLTQPAQFAQASLESLVALLVLGVVSTGMMTLILFRTVHEAGATFVSLATYLVPIFASLVGVVFLDESLGIGVIAGLCLVLLGLWLAERVASGSRSPAQGGAP